MGHFPSSEEPTSHEQDRIHAGRRSFSPSVVQGTRMSVIVCWSVISSSGIGIISLVILENVKD